jgi:hypothetical protein
MRDRGVARIAGFALLLSLSFVTSSRAAPPCATAPTGLVAWYPLNEQSGATTILDVHTSVNPAPPPHPGTPQPSPVAPIAQGIGPAPVAGLVGGGALYFYAGRLVAVPPNQPQLDFGTGDFSIDGWIRPVDVGQTVGGFIQPIVDKLDPVPPAGVALYLEGDTGLPLPHPSRLTFRINGMTVKSAGAVPFANPLANAGPWTHVAVTVRRSAGPALGALYINGQLDSTFTPPAGSVTNGLFTWIGETRVTGPRGEIAIDELEIFNVALTASQVADIWSHGAGGKCRDTVSAAVGVNQRTFAAGETLTGSAALANPDLPGIVRGSADVYVGALTPTGAVVFFTPGGGVAVGQLTNLASFRALASGVSLASPFSAAASPFFAYTWTGAEPHGTYVFFLAVLKAGALADGVVTDDEILGLVAETFSFSG